MTGVIGSVAVALPGLLAIAESPSAPSLTVLAPGFAEGALLLGLGMLAGLVGVIGHWTLEARIDRLVLKS